MQPSNPKSPSFFDDIVKPAKLWGKPHKNQESIQEMNIISSTILHKKGKKTGIWKKRFYVLTEHFVAYTKVLFCRKFASKVRRDDREEPKQ
jgi:hypothetical protein